MGGIHASVANTNGQISEENQRQMGRKHYLFMPDQYTGGHIGVCFNFYITLYSYSITLAYHVIKINLGNVVTNKKQ